MGPWLGPVTRRRLQWDRATGSCTSRFDGCAVSTSHQARSHRGPMANILQVLVHLSWNTPSEFELLAGIRDFTRKRPNWALRLERDAVGTPIGAIDARILTARIPD